MKTILFFLFLINVALMSNAEYQTDSIQKKYTTGFIYRMRGAIMKGPQKLTFAELGKEFSMSDIGLDQYHLAKRKKTIGKIFFYTSMACAVVAGAVGPKNKNLGFTFLGAQFITLSISIQSNNSANRFLDQAIQIRNKDYLFPPSN